MLEIAACCGCCSLRKGTIIIGTLQIIFSILMVILCLNIKWELLTSVDPDTVKIIYTITLCISIFEAILLLVGVFKRYTFMMLPWLILGGSGAVCGLINTICKIVVCLMNDNFDACGASIVSSIVGLMIYFHLWQVVYSYFKQVKIETMNNYQLRA